MSSCTWRHKGYLAGIECVTTGIDGRYHGFGRLVSKRDIASLKDVKYSVGQAGELEVWKGERYGVSFFWPVALPEDVKPLMGQAWAQESQSYFHSELIYDLEEDGRTIKLRHGGQECLVFELLEEGARDETS